METNSVQQHIDHLLETYPLTDNDSDKSFRIRLYDRAGSINELHKALYAHHPKGDEYFSELVKIITRAHLQRPRHLHLRDNAKQQHLSSGIPNNWFLSNQLAGMSLYVDRFCGNLANLTHKLDHFTKLGVNLLHLMPIFQSPPNESDGGYAVSDFRKVDERFGSLADLERLQHAMEAKDMYLMLDIVLNHTSHMHEWAEKAKAGDPFYQDFFYMYDDRTIPDLMDQTMPDIFPESSPGNFTYIEACHKWVMTVFHHYQWDLNYTNPAVFTAMMDIIFFYANCGVDVLRIDAPAFIWKRPGTSSQNLPEAHTILRLIRQCVSVATPGMALLGEAIVAPKEVMKYFGTGIYTGNECDFAYNATQMALQWDALATGDTRVMLAAQQDLLQKPLGASWITYTRCHDDIGLGYDDSMIAAAGFDPYQHRSFLKNYYSGNFPGSPAKGALFSVNPKTQDARISGSLAALCGLENTLQTNDAQAIEQSINKILLMQAMSFFIGGLPMLFYGDELGYTNDYSFLNDPGKSYDNRWMHRPLIDWNKNALIGEEGTMEEKIFSGTQKLLAIRKKIPVVADLKNISWVPTHNKHIAVFLRADQDQQLYCVFNFGNTQAGLTWYAFKQHGTRPTRLFDHWEEKNYLVGNDDEYLVLSPYSFCLLEVTISN